MLFLHPSDGLGYRDFYLPERVFRGLSVGCQRRKFKTAGNMRPVFFRPFNPVSVFVGFILHLLAPPVFPMPSAPFSPDTALPFYRLSGYLSLGHPATEKWQSRKIGRAHV